jgi:Tfp pilus assembly protein PilF
MLGLGNLGSGDFEKAKTFLQKAAEMDINHQGVQIHLPMTITNVFSIIPDNSSEIAFPN